MRNKKSSTNKENKETSGEANGVRTAPLVDPSSPLAQLVGMVEKKLRNFEKKKVKSLQLKQSLDAGERLNEDQISSAMKYGEILASIETMKDCLHMVATFKLGPYSIETKEELKPLENGTQHQADNGDTRDHVRQVLEIQNNYKRVMQNVEAIKALKSQDDKILTAEETDKLVKFIRLVSIASPAPDNSARLKKVTQSYNLLLSSSPKVINQDIGLSYSQLLTLSNKIQFTLMHIKLQSDSAKKKATESKPTQEKKVVKTEKKAEPEKKVEKIQSPSESVTTQQVVTKDVEPEASNQNLGGDAWHALKKPKASKPNQAEKRKSNPTKVINDQPPVRDSSSATPRPVPTVATSARPPQAGSDKVIVKDITRTTRGRGAQDSYRGGRYSNQSRSQNRRFSNGGPSARRVDVVA